ncbi:hypothetical protein IKF92_03515 [Candidatus Saccharibacteria bacterium]|nr:hypothetical protein [Candidatus Saccharibacteria bacterium]
MARLIVVYDDSTKASGRIKNILGEKSYGDMILKRQSMVSRIKKMVKSVKNLDLIHLKDLDSFDVNTFAPNTLFFHLLSSSAVASPDDFVILLKKLLYAKDNFIIKNSKTVHGAFFKNRQNYASFLDEYKNQKNLSFLQCDAIDTNTFIDLSNYDSLLMYISSGFDARYFNSLQGDAYTVTKRSTDKKKIKKEYTYYWLLPESMKNWMVMPYDYQETTEWASYTMERMPMTDIAIRWTHGAVDNEELRNILDKTFYFFNHRVQRKISKEDYQKTRKALYIDKLDQRIQDLKKMPEYQKLSQMIASGTDFSSIDEIVNYYKKLYEKVSKNSKTPLISVIGHGDVFFANMLYSKELNLLRFIDPKGALKEEELWTDPYYDIAKLSHSICGNYDFFNTNSYSIDLNQSMHFELSIYFDNTKAKNIFREYLTNNNYDYHLVRIYEASLFLSMLPLHIDNPHKVFGFILNAINILKEIDQNV